MTLDWLNRDIVGFVSQVEELDGEVELTLELYYPEDSEDNAFIARIILNDTEYSEDTIEEYEDKEFVVVFSEDGDYLAQVFEDIDGDPIETRASLSKEEIE